jgi:2-polyprenyl-3-methyl-5-hydroxy-6-metoxy-1,4-benzoquinol methylase
MPGHRSDSAAFYDFLALKYDAELTARQPYIDGVNQLVLEGLHAYAPNRFVDVGCGNGRRLATFLRAYSANGHGIDNSSGMVAEAQAHGLPVTQLDITQAPTPDVIKAAGNNDVALCLWNVLGHIPTANRVDALRHIGQLLNPGGVLMLDVNNRYNARTYSTRAALRNMMQDGLRPRPDAGDFTAERDSPTGPVRTTTHIFSPQEVMQALTEAGFSILQKQYVTYDKGEPTRWPWQGQLFVTARKEV